MRVGGCRRCSKFSQSCAPVQALTDSHRSSQDLWVNIDGKVYDLTKWAESHPGGHHLIVNAAGTDASGVFHAFHTNHGTGGRALKMLKYLPHVANMEYRSPTKLEMVRRISPQTAHRSINKCMHTCMTGEILLERCHH